MHTEEVGNQDLVSAANLFGKLVGHVLISEAAGLGYLGTTVHLLHYRPDDGFLDGDGNFQLLLVGRTRIKNSECVLCRFPSVFL